MLTELHLLRPWWLLLLPLVLLLSYAIYRYRGNYRDMRAICDPELIDYVVEAAGANSRLWLWSLIAGVLGVFALCGVAWQKLPSPVFDSSQNLVIVLDSSQSMNATDLAPDRLTRAKLKIIDLLKSGKSSQNALLVYAAQPYVVSPMTRDSNTIISLIPSISTDIMPEQGSNTELALLKALQMLNDASAHGDILLITDAEFTAPKALSQARQQGVRISIIGVGSNNGAPIPTGQGFLQDQQGQIVISKLNPAKLREFASQSGGNYSDLRSDNADLEHCVNLPITNKQQQTDASIDKWREQGVWLLLPILFIMLPYFRKTGLQALLVPIVGVALALPQVAGAATEFDSIFLNANQAGAKAFDAKDYQSAAKHFSDPKWRAAAQYRAGDFAGVLDTLKHANDAQSWYNKGNALANLGKLDAAIDAYNEALQQQPDFDDAIYNKQLLANLKREQQQQQQQAKQNQQQAAKAKQNAQNKQQQAAAGQNDKAKEQQEQQGQQGQQEQQGQQGQQNQQQAQDKHNAQAQPGQQNQQQTQDKHNAKAHQQAKGQQHGAKTKPATGHEQAPTAISERQRELDNATQQWLRQVPDQPSNLLRNQFANEYQRNRQHNNQEEQPW